MLRKLRHNLLKPFSDMDLLVYSPDIQNLTEIVKNRLYFAVVTPNVYLKNTADTLFFNTDNEYVYLNYYYDFGPLNISCLYKYCCRLNEYLESGDFKRIVHCTSCEPQSKANAAFLIGSFAVIYLRVHPREIARALVSGCIHFMPFADASQGGSDWKITLIDCFSAVQKAYALGFFNFNDFNAIEYDTYDKLQNGDLNWLLPRKFLAFIGPTDLEMVNYHSPEFYIQYFINNDVKAVIRLNNNTYNSVVFTSVGIEHYDLFFPDGSTPPKHILLHFLRICETTSGAIAVHCKAGLGRTGSLIAAYIIKHYRLTAREAIAWLRICRPGSVIGQQQGWLEHMESWLWRQGNFFRYEHYGNSDRIPHHKYGIYSKQWSKEHHLLNKMAKQKELQQYSSGKFSSKTSNTASKIDVERYSYSRLKPVGTKPANVRVLTDNNIYKSRVENRTGPPITQGDKLNIIKVHRQNTCSIHARASSSTVRSKYQNEYTHKKPSKDNYSKRK